MKVVKARPAWLFYEERSHRGITRYYVVSKKESDWKRDNLVSWYRAVDKRIEHSEWALAVEDVEEYILDLRKELDTPIYEIPSKYGYLWDNDDESLVKDEESSDSYEAISDQDDLQQHQEQRDVHSNDSEDE